MYAKLRGLTLMSEKEDIDTSISFLDPVFDVKMQGPACTTTEKVTEVSPDIIDPVFIHSEVRIPRKVEKVFKSVAEIKFIYSIVDDDCIEVVDLEKGTSLLRIFASDFDSFDFSKPPTTSISFIFNREKYKAKVKGDLNKKYKESIGGSAKFTGYNHFALLKERYLGYQLEHRSNFVFINDGIHLHAQIRSAVSILRNKEEYIPKVKKFNDKNEYLKGFLMAIPGISESVALAIVSEYGTFESIQCALRDQKSFCSLKVIDSAGIGYRTLSERVYKKIFNVLLSEDPDEKI